MTVVLLHGCYSLFCDICPAIKSKTHFSEHCPVIKWHLTVWESSFIPSWTNVCCFLLLVLDYEWNRCARSCTCFLVYISVAFIPGVKSLTQGICDCLWSLLPSHFFKMVISVDTPSNQNEDSLCSLGVVTCFFLFPFCPCSESNLHSSGEHFYFFWEVPFESSEQ